MQSGMLLQVEQGCFAGGNGLVRLRSSSRPHGSAFYGHRRLSRKYRSDVLGRVRGGDTYTEVGEFTQKVEFDSGLYLTWIMHDPSETRGKNVADQWLSSQVKSGP
jgi:hypothetical protein